MKKQKLICLTVGISFATSSALAEIHTEYKEISAFGGGASILVKELVSPKSALFSPDGKTLWVNALESGKTLAIEADTLKVKWSAEHCFSAEEGREHERLGAPFGDAFRQPNPQKSWCGKPVEMALSPDGNVLWVSSYRKSFDTGAVMASSVTALDARTGRRLGSLPSGPIPKMLTVSPDGSTLAVTNWGDNGVTLWDVSEGPKKTKAKKHFYVEGRLSHEKMKGNRDKNCGLCLRGTVFSPDGKFLLVARMSGAGTINAYDAKTGEPRGAIRGPEWMPVRHLATSNERLYASSTSGALVARLPWAEMEKSMTKGAATWEVIKAGGSVRTIAVSEPYAAAAVHGRKEMLLLKADDVFEIIKRVPAPAFPVGAAISADGKKAAATAQGVNGVGGHRVGVWNISN